MTPYNIIEASPPIHRSRVIRQLLHGLIPESLSFFCTHNWSMFMRKSNTEVDRNFEFCEQLAKVILGIPYRQRNLTNAQNFGGNSQS